MIVERDYLKWPKTYFEANQVTIHKDRMHSQQHEMALVLVSVAAAMNALLLKNAFRLALRITTLRKIKEWHIQLNSVHGKNFLTWIWSKFQLFLVFLSNFNFNAQNLKHLELISYLMHNEFWIFSSPITGLRDSYKYR